MTFGTEVGLGTGHIVLDGDLTPPPKKKGGTAQPPPFGPYGQTAGWIKMPLDTKVGLGSTYRFCNNALTTTSSNGK